MRKIQILTYSPKTARERGEKSENSWKENIPDKDRADGKLADFKAKKKAVADAEDEIAASGAYAKALKIQRDNLNKDLIQE